MGSGAKALIFLGRYLYRGVIQEDDILRCADGQVTLRYCDAASGKMLLRTVSGAAFLWLVLQDVLPKRRWRDLGIRLRPQARCSKHQSASPSNPADFGFADAFSQHS